MTDFASARANMVQSQLLTNGIVNPYLIDLYMSTPREALVPRDFAVRAYLDDGIALPNGTAILEPLVEARMLQAASAHAMGRVIVLGAENISAIAILSSLASSVCVVDENTHQLELAQSLLAQQNVSNVMFFVGRPQDGLEAQSPFDAAFVMGAVSEIPDKILSQLVDNGSFYTILKPAASAQGTLIVCTKNKHGGFARRDLASASASYHMSFMPKQEFVF